MAVLEAQVKNTEQEDLPANPFSQPYVTEFVPHALELLADSPELVQDKKGLGEKKCPVTLNAFLRAAHHI